MSDPLPVPAASNTFERIKRTNSAGAEFWSARELARVLEYSDFRNFISVITKARKACANSGHTVSDHFVDITEMVSIGSGAQRPQNDSRAWRHDAGKLAGGREHQESREPGKEATQSRAEENRW
jgi:DNA-damage-inducible protein D